MTATKTAIVILNWNGERFLKQFLPGVIHHSQADATVFVADNASTDNSIPYLQSLGDAVKIIQLDKNYGFTGGYNKALKQITADYYVLLNSDVEVTPDWIAPVLRYMDATTGMVACQPKILDFHRKEWFEYAGAAGGYIDKDAYSAHRSSIMSPCESATTTNLLLVFTAGFSTPAPQKIHNANQRTNQPGPLVCLCDYGRGYGRQ